MDILDVFSWLPAQELSIDDIKRIVDEVFKDKEIEYAYLFGSYAKESAKETSDVDLLVSSEVKVLKFYGFVEKITDNRWYDEYIEITDEMKYYIDILKEIIKMKILFL